MSNYVVTGSLQRARLELYRAADACRYGSNASAQEEKLHFRIVRLAQAVERADKLSKKLIPGGFVDVPNARDEDKRIQLERIKGGAS